MEKIRLKDLTFDELVMFCLKNDLSKFRARQIFEWLSKGVNSFDEMTNLSKELRLKLDDVAVITSLEKTCKQISKDGTIKYLFKLSDDNLVESVVMDYKHGRPICVSTQVGCNMGCKFCASTIGGKVRNLTAGEILDQIISANNDIGQKVSNITLMGIGEPLDNYDEVVKFIKIVNHPWGLNIGARHIALSTCGLVPKIIKLADEKIPITLSVSLHAPNDEIRNSIMPVNKKYPIKELMQACSYYIKTTNRRITYEYSLISGVNDSEACAKELRKLIQNTLCHVNLIPVNSVVESGFIKSSDKTIEKFRDILMEGHISTTIRRTLGEDIDASCGQLRKNNLH